MATLPQTPCKECGHLNEGERVYCHNCGVKLDRSHLAEAAAAPTETVEQRQRRVKKLMNPNAGAKPGRLMRNAVQTLLLAAAAAAVINMARQPDGVPEPGEAGQIPPLASLLGSLAKAPPNMRLVLKQDDINQFLATSIRPGEKQKGFIKFSRVYTTVDEEGVNIVMEQKVLDHPIHIARKYALRFGSKGFEAHSLGSHIGRLTIPEVLDPALDKIFEKVWTPLRHEHDLIKTTGDVETGDKEVIFYSSKKGAQPATAAPAPAPASTAPAEPVVPLPSP